MHTPRSVVRLMAIIVFSSFVCVSLRAQTSLDAPRQGFENPPNGARPRVWWHWMNGNITKEGIKLDLEWMNRIGLGGFQNFDAALNTPQLVDTRLAYMTPEWKVGLVPSSEQRLAFMSSVTSPGNRLKACYARPNSRCLKSVCVSHVPKSYYSFSNNVHSNRL